MERRLPRRGATSVPWRSSTVTSVGSRSKMSGAVVGGAELKASMASNPIASLLQVTSSN